eukprot:jgi/Botrbrau1/4262/Bobra.0390s0002.1
MGLPSGSRSQSRRNAAGVTDDQECQLPLLGANDQQKRRSTLLSVCPFILGNEFCERLAFYGMSTNLVIYLSRIMGESPAEASIQQMVFEGTCYLTPLLGAWLADSLWGRYKTILVFSIIYFVGMLCVAVSAAVPGLTPSAGQSARGTRTSLSLPRCTSWPWGPRHQTECVGPLVRISLMNPTHRTARTRSSFFNFFYFVINLGSAAGSDRGGLCARLHPAGPSASSSLQPPWPWPSLLFWPAPLFTTHVEPTESPMTRVVKGPPICPRRRPGRTCAPPFLVSSPTAGCIMLMLTKEEGEGQGLAGFTAEQVEEVRMVVRMFPIFLTTILYWTIYAQMGSFFVMQGALMNREVGRSGFTVPAASLALFNTLGIIILIPLYDRLVVLLRHYGKKISLLQRIVPPSLRPPLQKLDSVTG